MKSKFEKEINDFIVTYKNKSEIIQEIQSISFSKLKVLTL